MTLLFLPAKAFMQRILFDPVFWAELEQKLFSYYFEHFIKFASAKLFDLNCLPTETVKSYAQQFWIK